MIDNIFLKALVGVEVSEEEKARWKSYAEKYQSVIEQYLAKRAELGLVEIKRFHFTPGDNFENSSVEDVVDELIKFNVAPKKDLE